MFAPPPSDAQDSVSVQTRRVSPPRFCGCAARSGVSMRLGVLWDCHILYLSIGVEADSYSEQDAQPPQISESCAVAWYRGHLPRPPQRSMVRRLLPPRYCVWFQVCLGLSDYVRPHPPQTRFAHRRIRRLPLPVHTTQLITVGLDNSPDLGKHSGRFPSLERAMDGTVIAETLRQPVPLAARAHTEDDRVEHLAGIRSLASGCLWRIKFFNQRLNLYPKVIRHFPYRIKHILSGHIRVPPHLSSGYRLSEVLNTQQRFEIVS